MLLLLAEYLQQYISIFAVFQYLTLRGILGVLIHVMYCPLLNILCWLARMDFPELITIGGGHDTQSKRNRKRDKQHYW